jgi:hypothetical protein
MTSSGQPRTTEGYDALWYFAAERQRVYMSKVAGGLGRSTDPVIAQNRFTNAYRASDRVSQYLINFVQYDCERSWADTFVRTLIFKLFNRINTWEKLVEVCGQPTVETLFSDKLDKALAEISKEGPIYSAAYIMPPPRAFSGPKFTRHLALLRQMMSDGAHEEVRAADCMKTAFHVLRRYDSMGNFLAFQYTIDLNYSAHLSFSEDEFVVPGPGALRGIRKCFSDPAGLSPIELIKWTAENQGRAFEEQELEWSGLWGRPLQWIDVQNLFCEVDKYTRVAIPELSKYAPGDRIKQRYRPDTTPMSAWFPPRWGINERSSLNSGRPCRKSQEPLQLQLGFR